MGALSSRRRRKHSSGTFVAIPHMVLNSEEYAALTPRAVKLVVDMLAQYNGRNNGDLAAAPSMMRARGWKSKANLSAALAELLDTGFLVQTRKGSRNVAALYAYTWNVVDECKGKLDVHLSGRAPLHLWRHANRQFVPDYRLTEARENANASPPVGQPSPPVGQSAVAAGASFPTGGVVSPPNSDFASPPVGSFLHLRHRRTDS